MPPNSPRRSATGAPTSRSAWTRAASAPRPGDVATGHGGSARRGRATGAAGSQASDAVARARTSARSSVTVRRPPAMTWVSSGRPPATSSSWSDTTPWSASRHTCLRPGWVTFPEASFILGPSASSTSLYTARGRGVGAGAELGAHAEGVDRRPGRQQRGDAVLVEIARGDDGDARQPGLVEHGPDPHRQVGQVTRVETDPAMVMPSAASSWATSAARRATSTVS